MTTLDLYCTFAGWQGGTIHQALADFKARPFAEQSDFCSRIAQNTRVIDDIGQAAEFSRAFVAQHYTTASLPRKAASR